MEVEKILIDGGLNTWSILKLNMCCRDLKRAAAGQQLLECGRGGCGQPGKKDNGNHMQIYEYVGAVLNDIKDFQASQWNGRISGHTDGF